GARQFSRTQLAVAGARIDEYAGAGGGGDLFGERTPQGDAAEALVQHHHGRGLIGPRTDHAVFEPHRAELEEACVRERHGFVFPSCPIHGAATRNSLAKLCSTAEPDVSSSASARA